MVSKELENALKDGQEMIQSSNDQIKIMRDKINDLIKDIDEIPIKYKDQSEQFIQMKRDQMNNKLKEYQKILQRKTEELTNNADEWIAEIKENISKTIADKLKAKLGVFGTIFSE